MKDKHRRLAREMFWNDHDRETYECPDCGRAESESAGRFEVHHSNGSPLDNREENRVALCRLCHCLREDRKPPIEEIRKLRDQVDRGPTTLPWTVRSFAEDHCRTAKRPGWTNPLDVWIDEFEMYCLESFCRPTDCTPREFLRGLEEIGGAEVKWHDGDSGYQIMVDGVTF